MNTTMHKTQARMFDNTDLPLFSGTPAEAPASVFAPAPLPQGSQDVLPGCAEILAEDGADALALEDAAEVAPRYRVDTIDQQTGPAYGVYDTLFNRYVPFGPDRATQKWWITRRSLANAVARESNEHWQHKQRTGSWS